MISGVDIEAWREDEKKYAENHDGWEVQCLFTDGWKRVGAVFQLKESAVCSIPAWKAMFPLAEFRVYEVLK
jgi:hypothetical protein